MKQLVFAVSAMMIVFFFSIPVLSMGDRTARIRKLENATAEVTRKVLEENMESCQAVDMDNDKLKKLLEQQIADRLDEEGDIQLSILGADMKRGLLSVYVRESFKNMGGALDHIETKKTCILEQERMRPLIKVDYYLPDITPDITSTYALGRDAYYAGYELMAGEALRLPEDPPDIVAPKGDGSTTYRFLGWKLMRGEKLIPYDNVAFYKVGSRMLAYDGSLYGGISFMGVYSEL